MTVSVIPTDAVDSVVPSTDPAYDWQAQAAALSVRWRADATGVRGMFLGGGVYGLGLQLVGFTATNERAVGNILSFSAREAQAMVTYRVEGGRVKERIKLLAPPPVSTLTVAITPRNVHVEQAGDGGLWAVSNLDGSYLACVPAPTCFDANGVAGPARYRLSPDALTLYLDMDAAWLRTAAYPVLIDPTVVTNTSIDNNTLISPAGGHIFRMSDGKRVAIWKDNTALSLKRSTSTDGVTWTAPTTVLSTGGANPVVLAVCKDPASDNLYGYFGDSNVYAKVFKMAYAAGSFTDTSATYVFTTAPVGANTSAGFGAMAAFDTVKGVFHAAFMAFVGGGNAGVWLIANDTTLAKKAEYQSTGTGAPGLVVDTAATPNVYLSLAIGTSLSILPLSFSGTAYTGTTESNVVTTTTNPPSAVLALDQSANLDLFWVDDAGALKTKKRTGVNTYSAITTLVSSGVSANGAFSTLFAVALTGNANGDLYVVYRYNGNQTNGEVYQIKRFNGSWQAAAQVAGGNNTGWQSPAVIPTIQSDAVIHMVYLTGTSSLSLTYDGTLLNGNAPSAPTGVLPSGNANTSLTPTCSATYKNTAAADALGKYRVLVTRVSDGVVFWDTGAVTAPGAPTLALAAGSTLGVGLYRYQVTFVTQVDAVTTGETTGGTEASITTTTGNTNVNLTAIPTGPAGTTQRKIYRTAVGGAAGTEKLVATLNDNTTTTYTDSTADASLGAAVPVTNTASIGTAWGGATVTDGGTFSVTYAGTTLVKDTAYQIQIMAWDSLGNLKGPLSTAVQFKIEDAPVVSITGPTPFAAIPTSGPVIAFTYSQTLGHAQASRRLVIRDAGNVNVIYDSGTINDTATSFTVPSGTLVNGTTYQCSVTALSVDGL